MSIKRALIRAALLLLLVLLLPVLYFGITLFRAHVGLPEWSGTVHSAELRAPVQVTRDENGVPHIIGQSWEDVYFAQGFVHAQDRLWQMMAARQGLAGRMSEWMGNLALNSDRLNRAQYYAPSAREDFERLSAEHKALLRAYTNGVNAYLDSDLYRKPPEMVLLHVDPERWEPHDALLVYRGVYATLVGFGYEISAQRIRHNAAHPRALDVLSPLGYGVRPIIDLDDSETAEATAPPVKERSFSDSWVLDGRYTDTGMPLLANDPQLQSTLPNFWYLTHQASGNEHRVGATLPGIPFLGIGRTNGLAWGITNGNVDQVDAMLVYAHPEDPGRYRRQPGDPWQAFDAREEVFHVRLGGEVRETFYRTENSIIIPPDLVSRPVTDEHHALLAVRFPYLDDDTSLAGFVALNQSQRVEEAIDAVSPLTGPSLNLTLADTTGTIGYVSAGRYVIRNGDAGRILDFAPRDNLDWQPLPYDQNPRVIDPPSGRVVSANQVIIGDHFPHYLTDAWAAPHRALRIHELLDEQPTHTIDSFLTMQSDTLSLPARRFVPRLLKHVDEPGTDVEAAMLDQLRKWNYRFDPDERAPVVFLTWLRTLHERLARDELGDMLWAGIVREPLPPIVLQVLDGRFQDWCETAGDEQPGDCSLLIRQALADAAALLESRLGPSTDNWAWRDVTSMIHPHPVFDGLPLLGGMFSRVENFPGGPDTLMINHVDARLTPKFSRTGFTSSFQAVYDLSDLEQSRFMLSTGQSGHFRSPWYDNFLPRWAAGERFKISTSPETINATGSLALAPVETAN